MSSASERASRGQEVIVNSKQEVGVHVFGCRGRHLQASGRPKEFHNMVIRYDTSGIENEKNALTCRVLCAWPLSQSQACEAVYCVKIVEPRHNVGGAQSRVCNFAEKKVQACV